MGGWYQVSSTRYQESFHFILNSSKNFVVKFPFLKASFRRPDGVCTENIFEVSIFSVRPRL
jgi:hypothetical protein